MYLYIWYIYTYDICMQYHPPRERNVMEHSQSIASYTFIHPLKTMFLRPKHHQHQLWIPSKRAIGTRGICAKSSHHFCDWIGSSLSMHPAWRRVSSGLGTQLHTSLVMGMGEPCQNIAQFIMRRSWEVGSAVFRNRNARQFWQFDRTFHV